MYDSFDPMDYSPPESSVHGILQARVLEWVAMPSPDNHPDPGREHTTLASPALQAVSLPIEPPGKPWGMQIKTIMRYLIIITYGSTITSDVENGEQLEHAYIVVGETVKCCSNYENQLDSS